MYLIKIKEVMAGLSNLARLYIGVAVLCVGVIVATLVGEGKPIGPIAIAQEVRLAQVVEQNFPAITVSRVANLALRDRIIVSGLVGAVEVVNVQPLIQGQPIEALESDVGDLVTAGQVLARLSSTTLELQKSQFNAALASARATIAHSLPCACGAVFSRVARASGGGNTPAAEAMRSSRFAHCGVLVGISVLKWRAVCHNGMSDC